MGLMKRMNFAKRESSVFSKTVAGTMDSVVIVKRRKIDRGSEDTLDRHVAAVWKKSCWSRSELKSGGVACLEV